MARTANGPPCAFHRSLSLNFHQFQLILRHAEVESLSARNSVERRLPAEEGKKPEEKMELSGRAENGSERQKLRLTKSCPGGPPQHPAIAGRPQQNGLMKKSEIQMLREEQVLLQGKSINGNAADRFQMRRSEKERRRNERKQESKAAKTLSGQQIPIEDNVICLQQSCLPSSSPGPRTM